jgi:hypothetical protein
MFERRKFLYQECSRKHVFQLVCLLAIVLIFHCFGQPQVNAQNSDDGTIIGIVSLENITVESTQVTLYRLGIDGTQARANI